VSLSVANAAAQEVAYETQTNTHLKTHTHTHLETHTHSYTNGLGIALLQPLGNFLIE